MRELWWKAFQYVLDELPEEERAAFERELEASHAAREAVVEAMRWLEDLREASRPQPRRPAVPSTLPTAWNAVPAGTLALFLLLAVLTLAAWLAPQPGRPLDQLAVLWAEQLADEEDWTEVSVALEVDPTLVGAEQSAIPEWIMAGLEVTRRSTP